MSKTRKKQNGHRKTQKHPSVQGRYLGKQNGWIKVEVYGDPYQLGYAHGWLLSREIHECIRVMKYLVVYEYNTTYSEFVERCNELITAAIQSQCGDLYEEMRGITHGAKRRRKYSSLSIDDIIAWNAYLSMMQYYNNEKTIQNQRCSAFIATGSATKTGEIVMAHNTHCHLALGGLCNVIMYVSPSEGHGFCMQTCAGLICSTMDWFLCSSGIIGCETTISGVIAPPDFKGGNLPYFCRIRNCMQYGNTLDEYAEIMKSKNAGDYACTWFFGNVNTNEIMVCELGPKHVYVNKTSDGVYYGSNIATNNEVKRLDTDDVNETNTHLSMFSRNERLAYLLLDKYKNQIDLANSKKIISDHYDSYLGKTQMTKRCICKHSETNGMPYGAIDGKVVSSRMAKQMAFWGRYGSSCGRDFNAAEFMKTYPKQKTDCLVDLPKEPWIILKN